MYVYVLLKAIGTVQLHHYIVKYHTIASDYGWWHTVFFFIIIISSSGDKLNCLSLQPNN